MDKRIMQGGAAVAALALLVPAALAKPSEPTPDQAQGTTLAFQTSTQKADRIKAMQARAGEFSKALGLGGDRLVITDVLVDTDGTQHVRAKRFHIGLEVIGADLVFSVTNEGQLGKHWATFDKPVVVGMDAAISEATAQAAAKKSAAAKGHKIGAVEGTTSVIFIDGQTPKLAKAVTVAGGNKDGLPTQTTVYVDAKSGSTLDVNEKIKHASASTGTGNSFFVGTVQVPTTYTGSTYELRSQQTGNYVTDLKHQYWDTRTSRGPAGTIVTSRNNVFGNGTSSDENTAAADAMYGVETTYKVMKDQWGRNGYDDQGSGVRSRIHFSNNFDNAWWDGTQMTYGDGQQGKTMIELDVAAHEMAHGITSSSADLVYSGDAGGLNEATSDILGTVVEMAANNAQDRGDYFMGEKLDMFNDGTPLRFMDTPSKDNYRTSNSGYWSRDYYGSDVKSLDPHYSSGPANHWFYLCSEGTGTKYINGVQHSSKTWDGKTIDGGIGWSKCGKVWYRALTTKMTSYTTYPQARDAVLQSAIELYGANSNEARTVQAAWNGIKVPKGSVSVPENGGGTTTTTTPSDTPTTTTPSTTPSDTPSETPTQDGTFDDGLFINGNFADGETGWTLGGYASVLDEDGIDAGVLDMGYGDTASQTIRTRSNTKIRFWMDRSSTSYVQVKAADTSIGVSYNLPLKIVDSTSDGWYQVEADAWALSNRNVKVTIKALGSIYVDQAYAG